jgi:rare lipoprotein A
MVWKSASAPLLKVFLMSLLAAAVLSSCQRMHPQQVPLTQKGLASWYGIENHGKLTSCREVYDMNELTAAHRTLPFHSVVRVTNLKNNKKVVVRINDRGPFVEGRIIDLSRAAACALEMRDDGVVPVLLEILKPKKAAALRIDYAVQAGSFTRLSHARDLVKKLKKNFDDISLSCFDTRDKRYYRVRIKSHDYEQAVNICNRLKEEGLSPYIVEL